MERRRAADLAVAAVGVLLALSLHGCGGGGGAPPDCSEDGEDCSTKGCCTDASKSCFRKDETWAGCLASCQPGKHQEDPPEYRTPWSCEAVGTPAPTPAPTPVPAGWIPATWTTGYWDCCKPSCSWTGKGKVNKPVRTCDIRTGLAASNLSEVSVCKGGHAAVCPDQAPFFVNSGLSMGFAAAAVGGKQHGLNGDENCGQCFELRFTGQQHKNKAGPGFWGGAHPDLVGKRMIIQVTNIGYDVTGNHSFDIMIPGAGQGAFSSGCRRQFPGHGKDDFDCGTRYGGCDNKDGCDRLPPHLQAGCKWRYDWYLWLKDDARTNNPYVEFQRVKCPHQLVKRSGTVPDDDDQHVVVI